MSVLLKHKPVDAIWKAVCCEMFHLKEIVANVLMDKKGQDAT